MSQFQGMMGGSPGEGFHGIPENVHLGPEQPYGQHQQPAASSNVYQAQQQPPAGNVYQPGGGNVYQQPNVYQGQQQQQPNVYQGQQQPNVYQGQQQPNMYQGNAPQPAASSPYNMQSVTEGMAGMSPPSSAAAAPSTTPQMGSITQYATPPPAQAAAQVPSPTAASPAASTAAGSYAARSAAILASTSGASVMAPSQPPPSSTIPPPVAYSPARQQQQQPQYSSPHAHDQAHQNRILTDATRKIQEHAYYMKQAMDRDDLPIVLDRASHMVGELSADKHHLSPKNYYELHMRALDDMPNLEEYFLSIQPVHFVYDATQYTPKVLPRLYLFICAASAYIRSGEEPHTTTILNDLEQSVKCVQNPVRGLFLRHYLLQALRDKLPDGKDPTKGTVEDAYNFVMGNFLEMNKLWVRLQHLPGDGKSKEQRKKRERERNELRILVGTNLVRLSQMEGVTSQIYGHVILPKILEQIVSCGDPLAQAYLIDCIIQVFPDEYHIETLSILLAVCPKLRDKVNIRTILQSLMDRLAKYYEEEELLDEADTNQVKKSLALDSFGMFEECVQNVYNARGPKLTTKEVIRLQTALLNFSLKCYPGHMEQVNRCLGVCVSALHQASTAIPDEGTVANVPTKPKLDEASITELEKLLSIPLDTLALKVLELHHYADLLACLPWDNRRDVGMTMLRAIVSSGATPPQNVQELEELFSIIAPVFREEHAVPHKEHTARAADLMKGLGVNTSVESFGPTMSEEPVDLERVQGIQEENALVCKLVNVLDHEDTDVAYEMLSLARNHLSMGGKARVGSTLVPIVFSALRLSDRIYTEAHPAPRVDEEETKDEAPAAEPAEETKEEEMPADGAVEETKEEAPSGEEKPEPAGVDEDAQAETATVGEKESDAQTPQVETVVEKEGDAQAPQVETVVDGDGPTEQSVDVESNEAAATEAPTPEGDRPEPQKESTTELSREKTVSCRKVFVFIQKTVAMLAKANVEVGIKLYLQAALAADNMASLGQKEEFGPIIYELLTQAFVLYEDEIGDSKAQSRNIKAVIGTLLACQTLTKEEYESLIPKAAQYSAKLLKKPDQCQMVALCAHLFYKTTEGGAEYKDPQRSLECLKRALKLADASTTASASYVYLFVDLLDHYVFFYENGNPLVTDKYVSGLAALIKEHLVTLSPSGSSEAAAINDAKSQFDEILRYIHSQKASTVASTAERFSLIECDPKFP